MLRARADSVTKVPGGSSVLARGPLAAEVGWADTRGMDDMDVEFEGPVVEWRGPAPYYFVDVPAEASDDIKFAAQGIEYWGQVPVVVRIDDTRFTTALFPKDGRYLLPLKDAVRRPAGIETDQVLTVALRVGRQ